MSDTIYLVFPDQETAVTALQGAGYELSEYQDHIAGNGWGTVFSIPDTEGHFANIYDCRILPDNLIQYQVPEPLTPFNIRAGDVVDTTYRCVIVPDALRDTCRMMVVSIAGMIHANMWSTPLSPTGQLPATHWINSGPMRTNLTVLLDDAAALSTTANIPIQQAQYILSVCDISSDTTDVAIQRNNLQYIN